MKFGKLQAFGGQYSLRLQHTLAAASDGTSGATLLGRGRGSKRKKGRVPQVVEWPERGGWNDQFLPLMELE